MHWCNVAEVGDPRSVVTRLLVREPAYLPSSGLEAWLQQGSGVSCLVWRVSCKKPVVRASVYKLDTRAVRCHRTFDDDLYVSLHFCRGSAENSTGTRAPSWSSVRLYTSAC